jgi:hypothetical protein
MIIKLVEIAIVILIVLKVIGLVDMSWWVVLSPFWLGVLVFLVGVVGNSFRKR